MVAVPAPPSHPVGLRTQGTCVVVDDSARRARSEDMHVALFSSVVHTCIFI